MAEITVEQLAKIVGMPTKQLLEKLNRAGIEMQDAKQIVTEQQRKLFLQYLKSDAGVKKTERPTLLSANKTQEKKLKTDSAGKKTAPAGKGASSAINVTVIKKRVHYNSAESEELEEGSGDAGSAADTSIGTTLVAVETAGLNVLDDVSREAIQEEKEQTKTDENVSQQDAAVSNKKLKSDERDTKRASAKSKEPTAEEEAQDVAEKNSGKEKDVELLDDDGDAIGDEDASILAMARSSAKGKNFVASEGKKRTDKENSSYKARKKTNEVGAGSSAKNRIRDGKSQHLVGGDELSEEMDLDEIGGRDGLRGGGDGRKRGGKKYEEKNRRSVDTTERREEGGGAKRTGAPNTVINIPESLTVAELSQKMALKATEVIKAMMKMGVMATINQVLDQDTAALVAGEMGYQVNLVKDIVLDDTLILEERQDIAKLPRAPVVTIMGHVDHGKTSLLDYIRRTRVAAKEAGGITQRIGAYRVTTERGVITFLDTPGHEAFTAMRARGAKCTDIVVLVVAADDGVMPQTVEAIQHAHAAKVPIIVAINKIDKPGADPEKIKAELANHQVISEEWGGDTVFQNISAKRGDGIDELLESILIVAEMQQLTAPVDCSAKGVILEAHLDKGHGPVASILVQEGTLHQGDVVLAGLHFGKVRAMFSDTGSKLPTAGPSVPVEILGLSGVPGAGDSFLVLPSEKKAREISLFRQSKYRDAKLAKQQASKMENILARMKEKSGGKEEETKTLNVVLKTDLQGSAEAISEALSKLCIDNVKVAVVASGVGGITSSDVNLALASNGVVIGFNVRADASARLLADSEGIDLRYYSIIYQLLDDIESAMTGLLAPKYEEQILGLAEVREVFRSSKFGTVAGCKVADGIIKRGGSIRLLRSQVVIYEGEVESLRRFKDDVNEVRQGMECGIGIKGYSDIKVGDQIEMFKKVLAGAGDRLQAKAAKRG